MYVDPGCPRSGENARIVARGDFGQYLRKVANGAGGTITRSLFTDEQWENVRRWAADE